jgi:hypothetical protein
LIETWLVEHWWFGVALWTVAIWLDHFGTLYGAKRYREVLSRYTSCSGSYELSPTFQRDIESGRRFPPKVILVWVVISGFLASTWWASTEIAKEPAIYLAAAGAFLVTRVEVIMAHVVNTVLARWMAAGDQCRGRTEHARSLVLRIAAMRFWNFAALSAGACLLRWDWFFAGGAVGCILVGTRFAELGRKADRLQPEAAGSTGDGPRP